ncbi:hypothetical protein ACTJJ0_32700 [Chitinophaga sp. 22321]|uniref:Uncharacterized protein n=1 Tax=Chitinophaga hostae TaxID=2831022 RepID=A0ABS5J9S5_9BACT|nr:hypothetical protein [Chitinophaga hostae]MBS0031798.1 hypothetical protein [Chitinophaga hostae]
MKKITKSGPPTVWARVQQMLLIMKFTTLLLLLVAQASAGVYSQKKISLRMEAASLDKMLITLEKKSSYRFFFNNDEFKDVAPVSVDMTDVTVTEVLDMPIRFFKVVCILIPLQQGIGRILLPGSW